MNTSYSRKAVELSLALVRSPGDFGRWLRYLPAWGRWPADVELPWFSFGAIRELDRRITARHRVFEFGSGGSTFFFARRAASIVTIESDPGWHERVQQLVRARSLQNVSCVLHPLGDDNAADYRNNPFFREVLTAQWDVVVIDSFCGHGIGGPHGGLRPYAFELALPQVAPGGLLVLDDSWMFPELLAPRDGWEIRDFRGPGPCRYGVTSTAIFQRTN